MVPEQTHKKQVTFNIENSDIVRTLHHFLWQKKKILKLVAAFECCKLLLEDSQPVETPDYAA